MAQQTISIGTTANDGTGDTLRDAFDKANDNFTELYALDVADLTSGAATDGQVLTADGSGGAAWEAAAGGGGDLVDDATPQLGGALDLNGNQITGSGGTVTTSQPIIDVAQTWNAAGVVFDGVHINITDTAKSSGSSVFKVTAGGAVQFRAGIYATAGDYRTEVSPGVYFVKYGNLYLTSNSNPNYRQVQLFKGTYETFCVPSNGGYSWHNQEYNGHGATTELRLLRDAADVLAQQRTTNPQTYRLYNTWTDASNYERLAFTWDSNVAKIQTEAAGTGTLRDLSIGSTSGKLGFLGATPVARAAHVADADTAHALNATFSDTEVESALNALASKINSILKTLEDFGLHATS